MYQSSLTDWSVWSISILDFTCYDLILAIRLLFHGHRYVTWFTGYCYTGTRYASWFYSILAICYTNTRYVTWFTGYCYTDTRYATWFYSILAICYTDTRYATWFYSILAICYAVDSLLDSSNSIMYSRYVEIFYQFCNFFLNF